MVVSDSGVVGTWMGGLGPVVAFEGVAGTWMLGLGWMGEGVGVHRARRFVFIVLYLGGSCSGCWFLRGRWDWLRGFSLTWRPRGLCRWSKILQFLPCILDQHVVVPFLLVVRCRHFFLEYLRLIDESIN